MHGAPPICQVILCPLVDRSLLTFPPRIPIPVISSRTRNLTYRHPASSTDRSECGQLKLVEHLCFSLGQHDGLLLISKPRSVYFRSAALTFASGKGGANWSCLNVDELNKPRRAQVMDG